jgi:hypothetical protein
MESLAKKPTDFFDVRFGGIRRLTDAARVWPVEFPPLDSIHNALRTFHIRKFMARNTIVRVSDSYEHHSVLRKTNMGRSEEHRLRSEGAKRRNPTRRYDSEGLGS